MSSETTYRKCDHVFVSLGWFIKGNMDCSNKKRNLVSSARTTRNPYCISFDTLLSPPFWHNGNSTPTKLAPMWGPGGVYIQMKSLCKLSINSVGSVHLCTHIPHCIARIVTSDVCIQEDLWWVTLTLIDPSDQFIKVQLPQRRHLRSLCIHWAQVVMLTVLGFSDW